MSLKSKVQRSVEIAFEKLKDLAVTATFENKAVNDFDFSSGEILADESSYETSGFLSSTKSYVDGILVSKTTLTIRANPDVIIDRYSEVGIGNSKYNCSIVSKDDYLVVLELTGDKEDV